MDASKKMLLANKAWVAERLAISPDYFTRTATDQQPLVLWVGCSDSRVPAEDITGAEPGELFVHRNIANLVVHTDLNLLSVTQYAIEVLKVQHIIVCGHYGCGGVRNAMTHTNFGLINKWLRHIKDVHRLYRRELEAVADPTERADRLVEFNVREQVQHLAQTSLVQQAWHREQRPWLHGWVYDLHSGYLKELALMTPGAPIDDIYRFSFDDG
jgi:carbonic anhydrase